MHYSDMLCVCVNFSEFVCVTHCMLLFAVTVQSLYFSFSFPGSVRFQYQTALHTLANGVKCRCGKRD